MMKAFFVLDCELRARGICIYMSGSTLLGTVAITGSIYYSHLCILRLFLFYYNYIIISLLFSYSCMLVHNNETFGLLCFLMYCWWREGNGEGVELGSGSFYSECFWVGVDGTQHTLFILFAHTDISTKYFSLCRNTVIQGHWRSKHTLHKCANADASLNSLTVAHEGRYGGNFSLRTNSVMWEQQLVKCLFITTYLNNNIWVSVRDIWM